MRIDLKLTTVSIQLNLGRWPCHQQATPGHDFWLAALFFPLEPRAFDKMRQPNVDVITSMSFYVRRQVWDGIQLRFVIQCSSCSFSAHREHSPEGLKHMLCKQRAGPIP